MSCYAFFQGWLLLSRPPGCFIAEDVERINDQALEDSEDLTVHLFSLDEVKELLMNGEIIQATMAAPLWKYMAVNKLL